MARRVAFDSSEYRPCLKAFLFPFGAPGDGPPCIRHRPLVYQPRVRDNHAPAWPLSNARNRPYRLLRFSRPKPSAAPWRQTPLDHRTIRQSAGPPSLLQAFRSWLLDCAAWPPLPRGCDHNPTNENVIVGCAAVPLQCLDAGGVFCCCESRHTKEPPCEKPGCRSRGFYLLKL